MSFSEWINKKKATQEAQEEKRKSNTLSATGNTITFSEWIDNKVASRVDESYINNFISDASNFLKSAEKDYSSIKWDNASSVYNSKYTEWDNLNRRKKIINIWLNNNKDRLDKKFYNSLSDSLSNYDKGSISVINTFESANEYYSQWETEDAYKDAVKAQEDYEAMVNFDLVAGQKEIEGLLNGDEITALKKNRDTLRNDIRLYNRGVRTTYKTSNDVKKAKGRLSQIEKKIEEIEKQADQKQVYWNNANRVQTGIKLHNDALNAKDFKEKSQYVSTATGSWFTTYGMGYDDLTYEYINNQNNIRGEIKQKYSAYSSDNPFDDGESEYEENSYDHMTDEEIAIYNYYYSTEGKNKAEEYLKTIQEGLNLRRGNAEFEKYKGNIALEYLYGVVAGLDQFESGIKNLSNFDDDYIPASATQVTSGLIREDLADSSLPIWYNFKEGKWEDEIMGNSLGQVGYDLTTTTANMLPSIITSTAIGVINPVAGQVVGAGLMGASASGNAYAEMLNLGYDKGQARLYSALVGASEATLQYLIGGIGKLGGGKLTTEALVKIANNMDNAFARVAIKLGAEAIGEFTEEYLQEVLNPFFKNLTLGTNEDVKLFSTEALYSGILGALSAGILEGGSTIASDVRTTNLGKSVQKIDGGVARLKKLGATFSADAVAHQIADKITEETGAYKIGLLLQEVGGTLSEQNVSDIVIELTKKGMDESSAKKIAKLYQEFLNGEMSLTDEQVETLESLDPLANVLRKSIIGRNSAVYQRSREYNDLVQLATEMESESKESSVPQTDTEATRPANIPYSTEYIESMAKAYEVAGMSPEQAKIMAMAQLSESAEGKSLSAEEKAVESKFEVSADGKTINTKNDEIVTIKKIESVSDDGEANLTLNDGMVVKASDLSFGSDAEAIFIENIGNIKVGKNPIGTNSANALYHTAMNALKDKPNMTASEADSLIRGLIESYVYGTYNLGRSKLTTRDANGKAVLFAGELSQEQRQFAYELGTKDAMSKTEADQKVIDDLKAKADPNSKKKHLGKIIFEKGAEVDESTLTATQKANLDGIKLLAQISSVEFHVFRSDKEIGFKYTMADGTVVSANGWFVGGTNQIWVDLNAGNFGEGTMIRTAAHEISHYIKQWSPQKWTAMADLLMEEFAKNGVNTESMLNKQIAKIKRRYKANKKTMPSESVILDMAYEELVCDALADMLTDGSIVNFIAEVKAKDANLAKKILNAIKSLLKKWGLIIDDYKGRELDTAEAQALSQLEDTFKKLQEMYREAFMDANETVALVSDIASIDAESKSVAPMMSERTWTASEYVTEREKTAKAISSTLGVDIKTAYKYIDDINSVARLIADDRVRLDYDPNIDEDATVLKKNSEYKYSVDMSTLCAKRLLTTGTFDAIQRKLPNTVFTSEDIVALREMMLKRGYEVACGICYVESTRREMGRITQDFINSYIESQKTGKPIRRINSSGKAVDLKKTKDEMLTTADKSADKFYADKDYTPTLADLNTTDIDLVKKEHPLVYEAYLNFMNARGQAKPKLLETRAEYKGEILKHFKSSSAVKSRNDAGGLRLQSFSDFEVPHLIDMMQVIMDMSRVGLKSQAYTKVPAFAEVFGNTGVKINLSLIAKGSGLDANGNLIFDDVEGINHEEAFKLRDKFSKNVGTILVGKTDAHIIAAMADPRIDYIIPFHKSSWKESLYEALGLTGYADYTDFQNEKPIDKGRKIKNFDPSEYWDFTKSGDENAQIYLEKCRKDGRIPKFPQFQGYPGYWKLLIDFKMYDNDGVGSPQEVVNPTFEMDAANKILDEYKGGHRNFPVAKDVVEDFVNDYVNNVKFSERDSEGKELSKEQQEYFKDSKVRDKDGNLELMYHGSKEATFTIFDKAKKTVAKAFFFTNDENVAKTYAGENAKVGENVPAKEGIYKGYINASNPLVVDGTADVSGTYKRIEAEYTDNLWRVNVGNRELVLTNKQFNQFRGNLDPKSSDQAYEQISRAKRMGDNPVVILENATVRYKAPSNFADIEFKGKSMTTNEIVDYAYTKGFDSVIFDNINDFGANGTADVDSSKIVVVFDSAQFKDVDNKTPTSDPDIRYSERDKAYMDAVNNGDMKTAQRMVEEAARKAGYDSPLLYHGTQAFGFTKVKTSGVEKGAEWSPFFAASKEDISATYVPYGKAREISSSMDDDAISEARENAIEERKENITDLVGEFRRLIDRYFSEWVFGQTDNSRLEELVENANPEMGHGDGVYDVLSEIVYDCFYDYQDDFAEYEDAVDWEENSPEAKKIFSKILEIEGEKSALHRLELGEELGGIYEMYANLDNMYVVDGKGAAWNELRPEGLPKLERYGFKDVPYKTRDVAEWARDNGYDGVIFKNIRDNGAYGRTPAGDVYAFFKPESQVKSADPVTYDDNGNIVPLSERFNEDDNDIRYSDRDSEGKALSQEQIEFFKDSKVRDENGNLLVMYHGTDADFTEFNVDKDLFGELYYFAKSKTWVKNFFKEEKYHTPKKIMRVYLDIKKPLDLRSLPYTMTGNEWIDYFDSIGVPLSEEFRSIYSAPQKNMKTFGTGNIPAWWLIKYNGVGGKLRESLVAVGYDGLVIHDTIRGRTDNTAYVCFEKNQIKNITNKTPTTDPDIRYSLRDVDPVEPTSNKWQRTLTTSEVKAKFPDLWDVSADESEVRNPTQISGTVRSYRKVYDFLKKTNFKGNILDASSGLGYGTKAGIEEYGFDVEDIEPYPDKSYSPKYTDYSSLDKNYDVIISNAVLNVLPQDQRDALVVKMGELLKDGGRMFINVRGDDVKNASSKVAINEGLMEYYISKSGSYQKGFTKSELVAYLQDALGDGFSVTPTTFFGKTSAVVTKNEGQVMFSDRDITPITEANYKDLEKNFGTTGNFKVAGYLLTNGKMLDFSGKHWGDTASRTRQVDHRDVQEVLDGRGNNGVNAMIDMIGNGNIRLMPETGGICLAVYPNEKQRRVLSQYINYMLNTEGQIIIDYDAVGGDTVYSKEYGRTATSKQILNDIRNYFNGGRQSELMQFHTMYQERDPSTSNRSILAKALSSAAQNDIERNKLAQYKEKISLIEAEEQRLSEIQKQLFTKDAVEPAKRKELQFEAKQISNRINTYDRQLLNLEATTALKNVLNREKALAMKKQKQIDAEYLKQYKEKVQNDKKALVSKYQESRKKAVESRTKTAMRHKIKNVVNDLNNLLLKPSKERHVPEEMRIAVAEALALVNMDTVDADTRVAHYNGLIAKATDPDVIASLTETRDRILNQGNKLADKLTKLKDAYGMVRDSADDSLRSMYDDVIYNKIESVQKAVGKTPLRNMTLGQLESVYELYKMVLTTIRDSNKAFAENLTLTRQALGSNTFAEIKENNKVRDRIKHQFLEKSLWQNLKPMQAMKTIGSNTLQTLWNNILYGQEVFAQDYYEAVEFAKEMKDKHGYKKWNKDKLYSFESKSGKIMKLNLEQMMSIYAYSKRQQADEHIEYGGILLNESIIKEKNKLGKTVEIKVNDSTAYRLDRMQVGKIIETLEKEAPGAKNFVDEMQKYLSETMGNKGNEVSMKMYGVKLFKEEHYFPLKSSKDFMEAANAKLKGDVKIKNKGMTKSTVEHARTPIVLENFLDVWGNHINEMSMYHGLVLPLEDFSRTLNYSFKADDTLNTDAESVRTALHDAFGENADNYLNELLKAINGGVLHDSSAQFADKMISKFKKAKVMASLSVIVQQPTAIIRAMGIIEPKYFVAQNFNHKATWEELKTYCPTAIIKETGSFDTNMGRTIVDMIKDERGFTDKVGDFLGKAPAYMDEVGWNMIWRALKKKVATEQKLSGEELLKECGKQMTLIINETQVYDSVMSRNELMRSKNALTKMATAFMAEPSTVANMIYGATLDIKRGKKGIASKTIAATIGSVAINGLVSAMVYALRDDDEDETFLEKYLSSATTEVLDGLNPLTYIPFVKDAYSLFQGYKVERTDMALIKDVVEAIDDFYNVLDPEAYEGMSRKEIAQHIYDNSVPLLTSICDMFGLPVGNVLRDAEAIIINDNVPMSQTSSKAIGYAFEEGVLNTLPKIAQKVIGTDSKQDKLYDAIVDGDTAYVDRMKSGYKDEKAYEAAVRKALRDNDSRIREAAEARISGDIAEYARIVKEIKAEGFFSQDTIVASVNAEIGAINKGESSASKNSATENKESSIHTMDDYFASIVGGDQATAYVVKEDIIKTDVANGKDRDEAEDNFNSKFASHVREQYEDGYISDYDAEKMLVNYGGKSEQDAASKVQYWSFKQEYPDYDDLSEEAVDKYYNDVEPHGISIHVYYDYSKQRSKCKGTDKNGDGKTDSGSVKKEVLQVINSLPITKAQKDALYYINGWSSRTIYEAPWR